MVPAHLSRLSSTILLAAAWLVPDARAEEPPPNVVFIISDDQDFKHLGFMGGEVARTPNLDQLAGTGTVFTTGYLPMSVCRPTLASFLSGKYPHQSGIYTNYLQNRKIGEDTMHVDPADSIANHFKRAGYMTYASGKFWEGDAREQGFTHGTVDISFRGFLQFVRNGQDELFDFIDRFAGNEPMFIWWAPLLPHMPHNPPDNYLELYPAESVPVPEYISAERRESFIEDERKLLAMTSWFDDGVGRLLDKLDAAGQRENTLFVFVIDNGWANGLPSKHSAGEKSLRTPMFFTWPDRIPQGRRIDGLVSTMDLYPTMLHYAGASIPEHAVGRDLRPVLEARQPLPEHSEIGGIYPHYATENGEHPEKDLLALYRRDNRWKMVWYLQEFTIDSVGVPQQPLKMDFVAHPAGDVDLYDLQADPYEQRDLSVDLEYAKRIQDWKQQMLDWWRETGGAPIPGVEE